MKEPIRDDKTTTNGVYAVQKIASMIIVSCSRFSGGRGRAFSFLPGAMINRRIRLIHVAANFFSLLQPLAHPSGWVRESQIERLPEGGLPRISLELLTLGLARACPVVARRARALRDGGLRKRAADGKRQSSQERDCERERQRYFAQHAHSPCVHFVSPRVEPQPGSRGLDRLELLALPELA